MDPIAICRTSELSEAGAFFTQDLEGTPVLVTRDVRGDLHAFMNLCRHRGARLVHERQGVTKAFTCLLHGWAYDAEGNMGGTPLARMAAQNPMLAALRSTNALTPLPFQIRHGFVWVAPKPRITLDVIAFLGGADTDVARLSEYVVGERSEGVVPIGTPLVAPPGERVIFRTGLMLLTIADNTASLLTLSRRRTETDYGESTVFGEESWTLSKLVLSAL